MTSNNGKQRTALRAAADAEGVSQMNRSVSMVYEILKGALQSTSRSLEGSGFDVFRDRVRELADAANSAVRALADERACIEIEYAYLQDQRDHLLRQYREEDERLLSDPARSFEAADSTQLDAVSRRIADLKKQLGLQDGS